MSQKPTNNFVLWMMSKYPPDIYKRIHCDRCIY